MMAKKQPKTKIAYAEFDSNLSFECDVWCEGKDDRRYFRARRKFL